MKKAVVNVLVAAMAMSMAGSVYAAPSISQFIPEAPVVLEGNLQEGETLVVQNVNTGAYENQKVAEVVEWANDDNTVSTVKEVLTRLDVDTKEEFRTENGKPVNPTLYEQLTPFADLVIKSGDTVTYTSSGMIRAEVTFEAAKEMKKKDLLLMQIDPSTGKVYFITADKLDRKEGTITADFPVLGPVALLKKVPIVVKDVSPEKYENKKTAEVVTKFIDEKADITLDDVLTALGILRDEAAGENPEIQITDEIKILRNDYSSSMGFADLAIKQGQENYLYDMDGKLEAEANRDLNDTDWERMVLSEYPDFDVEAAKEDLSTLEELDPFVLEDSFIMQINPTTGEEEYIYEPEIFFAYGEETEAAEENEEEAEEQEETEGTEDTEEESLLGGWNIEDEDRDDEEIPNLVIRAEFKSMGPFAIFMHNSTAVH